MKLATVNLSDNRCGGRVRILALETSSSIASVAVLEYDRVLSSARIAPSRRVARSLAPLIVDQLNGADWRPADIQLIAVSQGPGSFTGLRVGVTTAKTLAYALQAELIGVDTLEAVAQQAPAELPAAWAVIDAQRQQLFVARFRRDADDVVQMMEESAILDQTTWLERLTAGDAVTGEGLRKLRDRLPSDVTVVDPIRWTPQATTIGRIASRRYRSEGGDDPWKITPLYYRKSTAEEKLDPRGKSIRP